MSYSPDIEPVMTAIIGAGVVGGYHAKALDELGSPMVVYDPDSTRVDMMANQYDGVTVARTMEEALELAETVHICSPPAYHMEGALASIAQGKPTIIEKPLTHDLDEAIEIYRAAAAADVAVLVGQHFRMTPPFLGISEGIRRGYIGPLNSVESTYVHDMRRLQAGVEWRKSLGRHGFVYEGAAHPVDLNIWLANQPVREIQATIGERKVCPDYGWCEDLVFSLVYEDNTVGRVWSNAASPLPMHGASVAVYGSQGAYRAHNKRPELMSYKDGDKDWIVTPTAAIGQTVRPMAALFQAYIRGERDNLEPMPDIKEALGIMIVLNTLERAAESGRTEKIPALEEVLSC